MFRGIALVAALLVFASPALASGVRRGTLEVVGDLAFQHQSLSAGQGSSTRLDTRAAVLRAVSDTVQLGGGMVFSFVSTDPEGGVSRDGGVAWAEALLRLNFGHSDVVIPYLQGGARVGSWYGDVGADEGLAFSPSATFGLRYPFRDAFALNLEFTYLRENDFMGYENIDSNTFLVGAGFSILPRGLGGRR